MTPPDSPVPDLRRNAVAAALDHARGRLTQAAEGSPDWEAAIAGVEALERELAALGDADSPEGTGGKAAVRHVGPFSLADHHVVQGTLAGDPERVEAMLAECAALAGRAATRADYVEELERIATRSGFVLESGLDAWGGVMLYVWEQAQR